MRPWSKMEAFGLFNPLLRVKFGAVVSRFFVPHLGSNHTFDVAPISRLGDVSLRLDCKITSLLKHWTSRLLPGGLTITKCGKSKENHHNQLTYHAF